MDNKEDINWPLPSFKAIDWAEAFCKNANVIYGVDYDFGHATSWFACALMRGYDESRYNARKDGDTTHVYELTGDQTLRFMKKVGGELVYDGTTNEEVIETLLDRIGHLNDKFPCRENREAINHLEMAAYWLNKRTSNRVQQGVEGQDISHIS